MAIAKWYSVAVTVTFCGAVAAFAAGLAIYEKIAQSNEELEKLLAQAEGLDQLPRVVGQVGERPAADLARRDGAAVGRPKRRGCALSARERLRQAAHSRAQASSVTSRSHDPHRIQACRVVGRHGSGAWPRASRKARGSRATAA